MHKHTLEPKDKVEHAESKDTTTLHLNPSGPNLSQPEQKLNRILEKLEQPLNNLNNLNNLPRKQPKQLLPSTEDHVYR